MMNKLNDIPKMNPFKVPENYFEEVNRKIISSASENYRQPGKISLYNRYKTYLLIAASVTTLIILGYTGLRLLKTDSEIIMVSEVLTVENPDLYLNDIDIYSLEENVATMAVSMDDSEVSNTDIIDYLLLDNIEITDIYAQL